MPITDKDILTYAQQLLGGGSELEVRACIGRSYYSAYHKGKTLAKNLDVALESFDGGTHQKLINMFTKYHGTALAVDQKTKLRSIGYMLNQARSFRVDADYDLDKTINPKDAATTYSLACQIVQRIDDLMILNGWAIPSSSSQATGS